MNMPRSNLLIQGDSLARKPKTFLNNFLIFVWFPLKIVIDLFCMLQNKVCLEHMLKMAPFSTQALLYTSLQIGENIW
jgi:hypothetical protein